VLQLLLLSWSREIWRYDMPWHTKMYLGCLSLMYLSTETLWVRGKRDESLLIRDPEEGRNCAAFRVAGSASTAGFPLVPFI